VPNRFFVNDIKADLHEPNTVYVVVDDHKSGDFSPYILKSENRGRNWKSISGNLPDRHLLWRVVQDHVNPGLMFLGTEFGVFFTVEGGGNWTKLKGGVPNIPFRDLAIQKRENDLVGATFGRSFFVLDDYTPLRTVSDSMLKEGNMLFPVRTADWYLPRWPLGCGEPNCVSSQGDAYFTAPNPEFGATFTYYLAEGFKSGKDTRRKGEKELEKANEDVVFAPWNKIVAEEREDDPAIVFTVINRNGGIVRQIEAPAEAGFHRASWNLRYPALEPWSPEEEGGGGGPGPSAGVLVVPGTFSVTMHKRMNGVMTQLGEAQSFDVVSIRDNPVLPGSTQEQRIVFETQVDELKRAAQGTVSSIDAMVAELDAVLVTLERSLQDGTLYEVANSIQHELKASRDRISDNERRDSFKDLDEVSVQGRLWHARFAPTMNAYGPTQAQRESLRIARALYDEVVADLTDLVDIGYAGLKEAMDTARVPWTPGRGIQK
jgi:hypothetical protein